MPKAKLGNLVINRDVWVRERISTWFKRDLMSALTRGETLPPLTVDSNTMTVVGGNHRYAAYKEFFGEGWESAEVEVRYVDLPPFEDDPLAWYWESLKDNPQNALPLNPMDRELTAKKVLDATNDPEDPTVLQIAKLLQFTEQGWLEFAKIYFEANRKVMDSGDANALPTITRAKRDQGPQYVTDRALMSPHALLHKNAQSLMRVLGQLRGMLTDEDRLILEKLLGVIAKAMEKTA